MAELPLSNFISAATAYDNAIKVSQMEINDIVKNKILYWLKNSIEEMNEKINVASKNGATNVDCELFIIVSDCGIEMKQYVKSIENIFFDEIIKQVEHYGYRVEVRDTWDNSRSRLRIHWDKPCGVGVPIIELPTFEITRKEIQPTLRCDSCRKIIKKSSGSCNKKGCEIKVSCQLCLKKFRRGRTTWYLCRRKFCKINN